MTAPEHVSIEGVDLYPLRHINVPKGDIFHILRATDPGYAGFGEVYISEIEQGEAKGWKRHNRMPLNIVVIKGAIGFVIYDDRPQSPTRGRFQTVVLSKPDNYQRLTVAPGLWMAFYGIAPDTSMLIDLIPEVHDPEEADRLDLSDIPFDFTTLSCNPR